jgi:hypothetical protein
MRRPIFFPSFGAPPPARLAALVILAAAFRAPSLPADALAATLTPATIQAWDRYYASEDNRIRNEISDPNRFLIEDFLPPAQKTSICQRLDAGEVVVERRQSAPDIAGGEIHHWWGAILVRNTTLPRLLAFLKDYEHHAGRFADVERSRLLAQSGNHYRFFFRLKRTKALITVFYHTEQECEYFPRSKGQEFSRSVATRIAELQNPGTASERERPPGEDRGFLWRLVSWWRFQQIDRGVVVECESASLSREVPAIVKFIPGVAAYIRSTPKESLESVLLSIRTHAPRP